MIRRAVSLGCVGALWLGGGDAALAAPVEVDLATGFLTRDSATFDFRYEMEADPANPALIDLDGNGQPDWGHSGTVMNGELLLEVGQAMTSATGGASLWGGINDPVSGPINSARGKGFTLEFRARVLGEREPLALRAAPAFTAEDAALAGEGEWRIRAGEQVWLGAGAIGESGDNATDFHRYRLAYDPAKKGWIAWRDGVRLNREGDPFDNSAAQGIVRLVLGTFDWAPLVDDFEAAANVAGSLPADWTVTANASPLVTHAVATEDQSPFTGGTAVNGVNPQDNSGAINSTMERSFTEATTNAVEIRFDFRIKTGRLGPASNNNFYAFQLCDSAGATGVQLYLGDFIQDPDMDGNYLEAGEYRKARLSYVNDVGQRVVIGPVIDVLRWYRATLRTDRIGAANPTFSLDLDEYVSGSEAGGDLVTNRVLEATDLSFASTIADFAKVRFTAANPDSTPNAAYTGFRGLDNLSVQVTSAPGEPPAVAIIDWLRLTAGAYAPAGARLGAPDIFAPRVLTSWSRLNLFRIGTNPAIMCPIGRAWYLLTSSDGGNSWLGEVAPFQGSFFMADAAGELHSYYGTGVVGVDGNPPGDIPGVDRFAPVAHRRTTGGRMSQTDPVEVLHGYTAATRTAGVQHTKTGRLVYPVQNTVGTRPATHPNGSSETLICYSDDNGDSWRISPDRLNAPSPPAPYNGGRNGAVEPVIAEFSHGRLCILMRTQDGALYQSFSNDGVNWTPAERSRFPSSNSPAALLRLDDDRILLIWNNTQITPPYNGTLNYSGRDVLHAAVSDDGGRTWHGFREILRYALRDEIQPLRGDRGTAYPSAVELGAGKIAVLTGSGGTVTHFQRKLLAFDANWLLETTRADDFSGGLGGWVAFKEGTKPAGGSARDRELGPRLLPHPDDPSQRVMEINHPASGSFPSADGAVWNFPVGVRGSVELVVRFPATFQGAEIALTDRFYNPEDDNGETDANFLLTLDDTASIAGGPTLGLGEWMTLRFNWNANTGQCALFKDGVPVHSFTMAHPTPNGLCYLRLRGAPVADEAGYLVAGVSADVGAQPGTLAAATPLDVPTNDDHGNSREEATSITQGSTTGFLIPGDLDYFEIELEGLALLTAISGGSIPTQGWLYDEDGNVMASPNGDEPLDLAEILTAGTYYVALRGIGDDETGEYTLNVVTVAMESVRPDVTVGPSVGDQRGDGLYNRDGAGQSWRKIQRKGRRIRAYFTVGNDGALVNDVGFRGTRRSRFFRVRYFKLTGGVENVTAAAVAGGYLANYPHHASRLHRVDVICSKRAMKNGRKSRRFHLDADAGPLMDRGRIVVKIR